ncbi:MAG: magnesium transporter CorA family protein [Nanoarchaeota archaeon]
MIEYIIRNKKGKLQKLDKYVKDCWINVVDPNEDELNFLITKFKLKKEDIKDGLDIHESPRFEIVKKRVYIFLTVPTEQIIYEDMSSFLVIYSQNDLITISKHPLEIFQQIFERYKKTVFFNSSRNLLRILFSISKNFDASVHKIIKDVKHNKTDLSKLNNKDIARLINHENKLNNYISSFGETMQTYKKVLKAEFIQFHDEDEEKLEDLINDLNETYTLCKSTLKAISNMRDYYSTKLSTDLNKTVTLLTGFTIFLAIPTLFASIYGMNVTLPFQNSQNLLAVMGVIVLVAWASMVFILKYLKSI